jgi:hypothetical protein
MPESHTGRFTVAFGLILVIAPRLLRTELAPEIVYAVFGAGSERRTDGDSAEHASQVAGIGTADLMPDG